jgi:Barrel-sandwich domain of CusB or HlyD membrane-fusion
MRRLTLLLGLLLPMAAQSASTKDAPAIGDGAISLGQVLTVHSDRYEVVLKSKPLRPGRKDSLDVYLSDFQTNAPIADATIALSLRSSSRELWAGSAKATTRAGIFVVPFTAPADTGLFTLLVTIGAATGEEERFALSDLRVSAEPSTRGATVPHGFHWSWLLIGILAFMVGLLVVTRRPTKATGVAVLLCLLLAPGARAHEGHDDAPASSGAPVGPGVQVYISKASQFLLSIRTEPLQLQPVQRRLSVMGRVAPRGGGEIEIVAPQSGRIFFTTGRAPVLGQSVTKGAAVARLTVVDDLLLHAPLTGVLTGVFVVNGQLVEAGQKLMTLLDPSIVWVHADVYEADVASVQRSTRAVVTSQSMPDLATPGHRVALGVTQGEVPGAVEAWFEVPNPGGRLRVGALVDVGIEVGGVESALTVPRSAVFEKDGRKLVFIHTAPERFTAREVSLGASLGTRVAVTGELVPGDRVVVSGGYPLLTAPVVSLGH